MKWLANQLPIFQANEEMLDLLLPKPGEGIGSEIAVGKLYASILIQDCFRRYRYDSDLTQT